MRSNLLSILCGVALTLCVAMDAFAVNVVMGTDGAAGGSWSRSLALAWDASVAPFGFDEVRLAYRPDLDFGGGTFESPFMSYFRNGGPFPGGVNFAGPERFDWSVAAGGTTYARATGALLSGVWLPFRVHHSGDMSLQTGFSYAWYLNGNYVASGALRWTSSSGAFLDRSQQEWEEDWRTSVPEPSTVAILGLIALVAAGTAAGRRRKNPGA